MCGVSSIYLQKIFFLRSIVLTSDYEGCPNAITEAMACGRASVATDVGDVPYLLEDGKTGFAVRRGETRHLSQRLATLITQIDLCRQEWGSRPGQG